eukprot:TRINITY_DN4562_c0_g3_i1.p1 TRINITY_DN4562_c0_g3~~TRINITY_DN4562_c0_g3_i1.p1  ORF type:complete len:307 (+),score=33.97 TRINITY_DN4562_c0_g3_i1:103-1023(+)
MGKVLQAIVLGAVIAVLFGLYWMFGAGDAPDITIKLQAGHPVKWDEDDVKNWVSRSVRYPEYADAFLANSVDGPTLFYMKESHLEFLGVENPVHRAKFLAHLDVLREECLCTPPSKTDFWEYMRKHQFRVVSFLVLFFYAPRIGSLYLIFFEAAVFADALSFFGGSDSAAVYYTAFVLMLSAPHVGLALFCLFALFPANYILAVSFVVICFSNGYKDFIILKDMLPGILEGRRSLGVWKNFFFEVDTMRKDWFMELLWPVALIPLGYFCPMWVQVSLIYGFVGLSLLRFVLYLVSIADKYKQRPTS